MHAYDLPLVYQNEMTIRSIAGRIGDLECFERPDELESNLFLRFKVEINILKPLLKGLTCRFSGNPIWISLKYESLPSYCFCCGVIGYFFGTCSSYDRDGDTELESFSFGPSLLKASPLRWGKGVFTGSIVKVKDNCTVPLNPENLIHSHVSSDTPSFTDNVSEISLPTVTPISPSISLPHASNTTPSAVSLSSMSPSLCSNLDRGSIPISHVFTTLQHQLAYPYYFSCKIY